MIQEKISIELQAFNEFSEKFKNGEFGTQRYGQAFHDTFSLDKMNNKELVNSIYYSDDETSKSLIKMTFNFH